MARAVESRIWNYTYNQQEYFCFLVIVTYNLENVDYDVMCKVCCICVATSVPEIDIQRTT